MTHPYLSLESLALQYPHKTCFQDFTTRVYQGDRIAVIGQNGSGKSSLLKVLAGLLSPIEGVVNPQSFRLFYVPQVGAAPSACSGAQQFQQALSDALAARPDVLLLDEPTNHLDQQNRHSLMKLLARYDGTVIIATHDEMLLRHFAHRIWHLEDGGGSLFDGAYDDFIQAQASARASLQDEIKTLSTQKKKMRDQQQKAQERAAKSKMAGLKKYGRNGAGLPAVVNQKRNEAQLDWGKKAKKLDARHQDAQDKLSQLRITEPLTPRFQLTAALTKPGKELLRISQGVCTYQLSDVPIPMPEVSILGGQKVWIQGRNGSGKSTLLKALLGDPKIRTTGAWCRPALARIGYLDQHYGSLPKDRTVFEVIDDLKVFHTSLEVRAHLNAFLFRKNAQMDQRASSLSGGERARLSLAVIAAQTPDVLLLDEPTNNVDLQTKQHILQVLQAYPGTLMLVSHDEGFVMQLAMDQIVEVG